MRKRLGYIGRSLRVLRAVRLEDSRSSHEVFTLCNDGRLRNDSDGSDRLRMSRMPCSNVSLDAVNGLQRDMIAMMIEVGMMLQNIMSLYLAG